MDNKENRDTVEEVEEVDDVEIIEPEDPASIDEEPVSEEASTAEEEETVSRQDYNQLKDELDDMKNKLLRTQADFDNFRRRTKIEQETAAKYRSQRLAEEMLPAIDNFERALEIQPENDDTKSLLKGVEMAYNQLQQALEKEGITPIEAVGQPFDPNLHQAIMQVEEPDYESNIVVEEMQRGYQLKDRVIRPSMVKVNA
ncbi:nucleotide exchange factor GrpE [Salisediminibacterium beveridgei]|uniref:Protein GrpE n=1 Tax=Salisediminibacterium beveridgei TaxID=632773 RepID=A0A1D7QUA7_9BACI|nr:nucleotide exchange factor GrpE [Salisediminibacterium beveridgei]AOM82577.1 Heat shock protein GrpE [Salisediminibacterium beveridgei]